MDRVWGPGAKACQIRVEERDQGWFVTAGRSPDGSTGRYGLHKQERIALAGWLVGD